MEVHLSQADGMTFVVGASDGWHTRDVRMFRHRGQCANRTFHGSSQITVHRFGDVERSKIAGHVTSHVIVGQILMIGAWLLHLEDLRAQVAHGDSSVDRVGSVHSIFEHHVRVSGFELQFGQSHEELSCVDVGFPDAFIVHHIPVVFADGDIGEGSTHDAFDVIWAEQGHRFVSLRQLECDVGYHYSKSQRFDTDLLIRVLAFGIEEMHDVRMMSVEVHCTGTLSSAQLVGVAERVLKQFHHRHNAAGLVFDALDGRAGLAQIAKQQRDASTSFAQLQCGVDATRYGLHVVFDTYEKTADRLSALRFAEVEESGRRRLETS